MGFVLMDVGGGDDLLPSEIISDALGEASLAVRTTAAILCLYMKAIKGVLLTCDQTTKQVILQLNDIEHFVIEDLDDTHLFVNADCVPRVTAELERLLEENSYKLEVS